MEACDGPGMDTESKWFGILQLVVVPLTVAAAGFAVQQAVSETSANTEYVSLAVSVLSNPAPEEESDVDQALREWAVSLLQDSSPVDIPEKLAKAFEEGDVVLDPDLLARIRPSGSLLRPESSLPAINICLRDTDGDGVNDAPAGCTPWPWLVTETEPED